MQISIRCSVAIHCLLFIHEYGHTRKVTSELLALSTGTNPVTVRSIMSALRKADIVSVRSGTGGATLTQPPEDLSLLRICAAVEPDFSTKVIGIHSHPSAMCPIGRNIAEVLDHSYRQVRDDLCRSLDSISLAQIISDYHRIPETAVDPLPVSAVLVSEAIPENGTDAEASE